MSAARFEAGQPVRSTVNAQGLRQGALYRVIAVEERSTFMLTYVRYQVRSEATRDLLWVENGHLVLTEVDTSSAGAILALWSDGGRPARRGRRS